jgi:hypothetical protein
LQTELRWIGSWTNRNLTDDEKLFDRDSVGANAPAVAKIPRSKILQERNFMLTESNLNGILDVVYTQSDEVVG